MSKFNEKDLKLSKFDASDYLETEEDIKLLLKFALEDYNEEHFKSVLKNIIKAWARMNATAKKTGIPGTTLYRQLSKDGKLTFENLLKISKTLGIKWIPIV
jgi:probable addiction module antidote protein